MLFPIKITIPRLRPEQQARLDPLCQRASEAKGLLAEAERIAEGATATYRKAPSPAARAALERAKTTVERARATSQKFNREAANAQRAATKERERELAESRLKSASEIAKEQK